MKIMMIGYLPPPIGGVTILFKQLIDDIELKNDVNIIIIDLATDKKSIISKFSVLFNAMYKAIKNLRKVDIIAFHGVTGSTVVLGPIFYWLSKVFNKKILIREFGGVFHNKYNGFPFFIRLLINNTVFKSDLLLFETKELVTFFNTKCSKKVKWYPNNRQLIGFNKISTTAKKFIFISQMKGSKGVKEIFNASKFLPKDILIHLYGPLNYDLSKKEIEELNKDNPAQYISSLKPEEVSPTLRLYDVLLLPTYHYGEGYPGIILEAYSHGIPVITTNWNAIPEIVDETSGILIEPQDVNDLINAIMKIYRDAEYFNELQKGARDMAKYFSSKVWSNKFITFCKEIL